MNNNWNVERISRKGESYKWDGTNTDFILGFLASNSIIGELYRDGEYILIKQGGYIATSIKHGTIVLKGEDGKVRYYSDEEHKLMYRPIVKDDELERLRAFVSDVYDIEMSQNVVESIMKLSRKHGSFPVSKKAPE